MRNVGVEFGRLVIVKEIKGYQQRCNDTFIPIVKTSCQLINVNQSDRDTDLTEQKYCKIGEAKKFAEVKKHITSHWRMFGISEIETAAPHQCFGRIKMQRGMV